MSERVQQMSFILLISDLSAATRTVVLSEEREKYMLIYIVIARKDLGVGGVTVKNISGKNKMKN
jgi:hypothetical protein